MYVCILYIYILYIGVSGLKTLGEMPWDSTNSRCTLGNQYDVHFLMLNAADRKES